MDDEQFLVVQEPFDLRAGQLRPLGDVLRRQVALALLRTAHADAAMTGAALLRAVPLALRLAGVAARLTAQTQPIEDAHSCFSLRSASGRRHESGDTPWRRRRGLSRKMPARCLRESRHRRTCR